MGLEWKRMASGAGEKSRPAADAAGFGPAVRGLSVGFDRKAGRAVERPVRPPIERLKGALQRLGHYIDSRRAAAEVVVGPPGLPLLLSARDRVIPYIDDLGFLQETDGPFLDRAYRRPALRYALARLPLVLVPCESHAAALRPFASPSTDLVVCRPAIADAYALAPFADRAVALRAVATGGRLEIAAFVRGGDFAAMEGVAGLVARLRKDHGFEARAHLLLTGGGGTCPDDLQRRPGIVFHGTATADRIREILIEAHLLVGASDSGCFSDVPLEACYAGLPAVMPDRPAFREAFGGSAFHLDLAAPDSAGRIVALLARPGLFQRAREAADANLARWNAWSETDRRTLLAGLRHGGLSTDRLERAVPFLPSRVRT